METQWTRMTADEAAEIIQHNDMVAFSGFTPAGSPKALPTAIARRANEQHEAKKPYQIRLLTGASISAAADDVLSDADAVSWRAPYQTSSGLRKKINQGAVDSIGQRNSYVKTWGCGGFLNETNIYSRGKSLCF
ncbi:hypothetical protein ACSLOK_08350, partial [Escherichia coli]